MDYSDVGLDAIAPSRAHTGGAPSTGAIAALAIGGAAFVGGVATFMYGGWMYYVQKRPQGETVAMVGSLVASAPVVAYMVMREKNP